MPTNAADIGPDDKTLIFRDEKKDRRKEESTVGNRKQQSF